jgi:hypothetical protein
MFVAYLLPHPTDVFNLLEDGIQWIATGETKEKAEANLREKFEATMRSDFYSKEEAETIWKQHQFYCTEA